MARRRRSRRHELAVNSDINLTNLIDVALVLLIIFMMAAPIMAGGVDVQLPRAETAPIASTEGVIVTVSHDGKTYVGEVPASSPEEFRALYTDYVQRKGVKDAYLRADRDVPYGRFLQVLGMMKKLNVAEVGLVAEPELEK